MTEFTSSDASKWPTWYNRVAPYLVVLALVLAIVGAGGVFALTFARSHDQQVRDREQNRLLACIDDALTRQSSGNTKTREAAQARDDADDAVTQASIASDQALLALLSLTPSSPQRAKLDAFEAFKKGAAGTLAAEVALSAAKANLDAVRKENPVVPAPSVLCARND